MLIQEGVIDERASNDFNRWYCSLKVRKKVFDKMKEECMDMKDSLERIQLRILRSLEKVSGQDVNDANGLNLKS